MAERRGAREKGRFLGWLISSLVLIFLMVGGFGVGLVVGFVVEEPTLVAGHIVGRTTAIDWGSQGTSASTVQGLALGDEIASPPSVGLGPPSSAPKIFAIQVGAFGDPLLAASLAEDLRSTGYPVQVLEPLEDDRWRVRVGPLSPRVVAEEMALRLKRENRLPTWILDESGN